ncbi:MAG: ATP-binding cassette domain-containing protein [Bacteroidetes bacterium]|nr:ATP-binding cassette domain-containing protein [Bacteroidota bacterium]
MGTRVDNTSVLEAKLQHVIAEPIIEIKHLVKSFGENKVLKDFNLTLHSGENVVVLGKSGCGKSVLIKCIVGLLKYEGGSIEVYGNEVATLSQKQLDELRAKIGFVFQSSALYDSMTVCENLEFALRRHGKKFSKKGKRIGLARSLVLKPQIMLYDEPTTGLDPITAREISNLMLNMQLKYRTSSIIISHDMHCAQMTADKMAVMIDGICYAEGTFDELNKIQDPKVKAFFE